MESSILSAAQGFKLILKPKTKTYRDKFGHICTTAAGLVRIARAQSRAAAQNPGPADIIAAILFQHEVKEALHENGFVVDRFLVSVQGGPYFRQDNDVYTACAAFGGPIADFTDADMFLHVVAHVARMHNTLFASKIAAPSPIYPKIGDGAVKSLASLASLKKKLLRAGRFSEFDMLFLRGYDALAPHIAAFSEVGRPEDDNAHICHNILKEENIYRQDQLVLTNFGDAARAHHLYDLAYLIKRYIKANAKTKETISLKAILQAYRKNAPNLADFDEAYFARILLYPDKFIKVAGDYYRKKRSFAPNTYLTRIKESLRVGEVLSRLCGSL